MARLSGACLGVALNFVVLGCGNGHPGRSPESLFLYDDVRCSTPLPDGGVPGCQEVGDGASYPRCVADRDCPTKQPFCRILGLYQGGDFSCNGKVLVCRSIDRHDCPPG